MIHIVRYIVLLYTFLASLQLYAQKLEWSAGIFLGEPIGIFLRKFISKKSSFELTTGIIHIIPSTGKFERDYIKTQTSSYDYILFVQPSYGWYQKLNKSEDLEGYLKLGIQARYIKGLYYLPYCPPELICIDNPVQTDKFMLGLNNNLGVQYNFSSVPVSIFLELGLYEEFYDNRLNFGILETQGFMGILYRFQYLFLK